MASSSSSSSSSVQQKFQVFLSFRGEDTRNSFTSHLHAALKRKGIDTYVDYRLERGEKIETLFTVIEESTISIIILSKNYASSSWCLDELSKILECNKTNGQKVVPIFYHVDPSDVRHIRGSFKEALEKQQDRFKNKVEGWRAALVEVAGLVGCHLHEQSDRLESKVVEEIAEDISKKLMCKSFVDTKPLVGINSRVKGIELLLCFNSKDVRIVGIWGMGGIGKTTIAEAVYNRFFAEFEGYCFINVTEEELKYGRVHLRQKLFSEILGDKNLNVGTSSVLDASIIARLQHKKVFIILDDVNDSEQLDLLSKKFGPGSRIIVTSRDKQLLELVVDVTYEVRGLLDHEALRLFSLFAFKQNHPKEDFMKLSMEVVCYVKGLPLALRVFGSSLYGKSTLELWKGDLKKLKEIPNPTIDNILRISYDGLDREVKDIFLDIACFFNWKHRDYVEDLLGGCYISAKSGITDLVDRSLLTIPYDNRIVMHDLLQQMARNIICQESKKPGKRSRLWTPEDICHVLENNTVKAKAFYFTCEGTESVEVMLLDVSKISRKVFISPTAFARMYKLKILKFYHSDSKRETKLLLKNGLVSLPSILSYLHWDEYPSKSLPSNFCPMNVVELSMRNSHVKQLWDGVENLVKLKRLDLSYSQYLIKIPDLSEATNLEEIMLVGCTNLKEVPPSIQYLDKLSFLSLEGCGKLENFPSIVRLGSLKALVLTDCSNIIEFPEIPQNLKELSLSGTAIEEVPSSIGRLSRLKYLYLSDCRRLERLPNSISKLKFLHKLDLKGCLKFKSFPEISETMECLKYLDLRNTLIEELHSSIANLVGLIRLELDYCEKLKNLPSSIRELKSLKVLSLINCSNVTKFLEIPRNLERLNLSGTSIEQLPSSIVYLSELNWLSLDNCAKLGSLPRNISELESLHNRKVFGFSKLEVIQEFLGDVKVLNIHPSNKTAQIDFSEWFLFLDELPDNLDNFKFLDHLCLRDCSLSAFPSRLTCVSSLRTLDLCGNDFETIPVCIKQLLQLHKLDLRYCKRLQSLPELPPRLRSLDAHDCTSLEAVSSAFPFNRYKDQIFMFTNCQKLGQNCINLAKTLLSIQQKATEDVKLYYQEPNLEYSLSICFPRTVSEIPEWFSSKNQGSSVTIQLPHHLHDDKFVGFAVCAVLAFSDDFNDYSLGDFTVACRFSFKTDGDDLSNDFDDFFSILYLWGKSECSRFINGDHVFLGYDFKSYDRWYKEESEHHLNEASTEFSVCYSKDDDLSDFCVVKECGVCLLYAQDDLTVFPDWSSEESNPLMIQPSSPYPISFSLKCGVINQVWRNNGRIEDDTIIDHESGSSYLHARPRSCDPTWLSLKCGVINPYC